MWLWRVPPTRPCSARHAPPAFSSCSRRCGTSSRCCCGACAAHEGSILGGAPQSTQQLFTVGKKIEQQRETEHAGDVDPRQRLRFEGEREARLTAAEQRDELIPVQGD